MNTLRSSTKHTWAFLVHTKKGFTHRRGVPGRTAPKRNRYQYMVVACSKEARAFGVRAGMRYDEARKLIPDLRVLVCNR